MDLQDCKLERENEGQEEFYRSIYFKTDYNIKFQMKSDFVGILVMFKLDIFLS